MRTPILWVWIVVLLSVSVVRTEARKVYWTDGRGIHCADTDGANRRTLFAVQIGNPQSIALDPIAGKIYWTDLNTRRIQRANLDGTDIEEIVATGDYPRGIAIDTEGRKLYWIEAGRQRGIQRANLDGTAIETFLVMGAYPRRIAVDANTQQVFWTDALSMVIQRIGFDGVGARPVVKTERGPAENDLPMALAGENLYWPVYDQDSKTESIRRANPRDKNEEDVIGGVARWVKSMAVDPTHQRIYWASYDSDSRLGRISCANLDGTDIEILIQTEALRVPTDISVDAVNGKFYWIESIQTPFGGTGRIRWANLDGTEAKDLIDEGLRAPCGLDVDPTSDKLYWTDFGTHKIQRANLDSTGIEDLVLGLQIPLGLAVDEIHGKMYWTDFGAGKVQRANLDGTGVETLVETGVVPEWIGLRSISVDTIEEKIYWTDGGSIFKANVDGTDRRAIGAGGTQINGVFVDESRAKLYWTSNGFQLKVEWGNLNASIREEVFSYPVDLASNGENRMRGVTADVANEEVYWLDLRWNTEGLKKSSGFSILIRELPEPRMVTLDEPRPTERLPVNNDGLSVSLGGKQPVTWARLRKDALLQNYPNPFNPETWIPFELAHASEVTITIFNIYGQVVRTLNLSQQEAGYHTEQSKAAYWDGRSDNGERVASGVYFYRFDTDTLSAIRRMTIIK